MKADPSFHFTPSSPSLINEAILNTPRKEISTKEEEVIVPTQNFTGATGCPARGERRIQRAKTNARPNLSAEV